MYEVYSTEGRLLGLVDNQLVPGMDGAIGSRSDGEGLSLYLPEEDRFRPGLQADYQGAQAVAGTTARLIVRIIEVRGGRARRTRTGPLLYQRRVLVLLDSGQNERLWDSPAMHRIGWT